MVDPGFVMDAGLTDEGMLLVSEIVDERSVMEAGLMIVT